jgi:diadenosine tetraphosphate (Ap4A) HIT family hydrolase
MLMMFDKHVHFHIFPRYEQPVSLLNDLWIDKNWPGIPV